MTTEMPEDEVSDNWIMLGFMIVMLFYFVYLVGFAP